jgi:glycosyltransferase involved in cell wall biosynthesis
MNILSKLPFLSQSSGKRPIAISIGITTFAARFEEYFKPLLTKIREIDSDIEIVVAVNGEHKVKFDEAYRQNILAFLASQKNVFPVFFPTFRGLAKLWNTIIIHASHDYILLLNDDIMIDSDNFLINIEKKLRRNNFLSFTINRSWSHFLLSRKEIDDLGYFDERLLGIGEEDGDITWRYYSKFGRTIADYNIRGVKNYAEETVYSYKPANIACHSGTKYSQFNRDFMFSHKYRPYSDGYKGMFAVPVSLQDPCPVQYPNEKFYRTNRDKL